MDMCTLDRNFEAIPREFRTAGNWKLLWEAPCAGIKHEYRQIEKLAQVENVLRPYIFKVTCLLIKIQGGSGGWCRAVAFV